MSDFSSIKKASLPSFRHALPQIVLALACLLAISLAALAAHWLVSSDELDKMVTAQIRRTTGFAAKIYGPTQLYLFPQPHIDIREVRFVDADHAIQIGAPRLSAYLRMLPFLVGRFEVGHATLDQPRIVVALDRMPKTTGSAINRAAGLSSSAPDADSTLLGLIDVVDGRIELQRSHAPEVELAHVTMSVDWPRVDASAALNGEMTLGGQLFDVQAWLSQPIELLRGGQSAGTLRLNSDVLAFSTSGTVSAGPHMQYSGRLSAAAPSLRKVAELLNYPFTPHGTFADLAMRCDVDTNNGNADLTNLRLSLDGNDYEGNLAVGNENGLARLSGTLASDFLDVTPFLSGLPKPDGAAGLWSKTPLNLADLGFADLDLRVSASRLRLYDIEIEDAALSLVTKPGLVDLALAEATANHGTVKGRISLAAKGKNLDLQVNGSGTGIDIGPMILGSHGTHPLSGSLDASVGLESTGPNFDLLMQGLAGNAEFAVKQGQIAGVDLNSTLQDMGIDTVGKPIKIAKGVTTFDDMSVGMHIKNGVANIDQGHMTAQGMHANFVGTTDIGQRTIDLSILAATMVAPKSPRHPANQRWLDLKGPWTDLGLYGGEPNTVILAPPRTDALPDAAMSFAPPQ